MSHTLSIFVVILYFHDIELKLPIARQNDPSGEMALATDQRVIDTVQELGKCAANMMPAITCRFLYVGVIHQTHLALSTLPILNLDYLHRKHILQHHKMKKIPWAIDQYNLCVLS